MIKSFFDDVSLIWNSFSKPPANQMEENKVYLAAARVLGSIFMVSGAFKAITAVPILISSSGLIDAAIGVTNCVLGYDVFVMARNLAEMHNPKGAFETFVASVFKLLTKDSKAGKEELAKQITKATIIPVWQASHSLWLNPLMNFLFSRKKTA